MRHQLVLLAAAALSNAAAAQVPKEPRLAPRAVATSAIGTNVTSFRVLPGGRLIVNDAVSRKLVLLDSMLVRLDVLMSGELSGDRLYPGRGDPLLIAFRADSSLLTDPSSASFLVIDPEGRPRRVMAAPRPSEVQFLNPLFGYPLVDTTGRLVYGARYFGLRSAEMPAGWRDSAPIIRVNIYSRASDSIARVGIPRAVSGAPTTQSIDGTRHINRPVPPYEIGDDWVAFPDGSIAVIRQSDFHVDLFDAHGVQQKLAAVPWPWQRISDADKSRIADSLKITLASADSARRALSGSRSVVVTSVPVPVSEMPDYIPPFIPRTAHLDARGRIWLRETGPETSSIYVVVDGRSGQVVDRIQFASGRTLLGFGDRDAYLQLGSGPTRRIERVRLDR